MIMQPNPIRIICVLKSGGDYDIQYVENLHRMCERALSVPHKFVCITDVKEVLYDSPIPSVTLLRDRPGWWNKLEVFRFVTRPSIYLDLDTFIPEGGSLDSLAMAVAPPDSVVDDAFWMLEPFSRQRGGSEPWASGIMAWSGNWFWLHSEFKDSDYKYEWDQRYISTKLRKRCIDVRRVQDHLNVKSYKWHCKDGIPDDTDVVCFHGHPRPHEVGGVYWNTPQPLEVAV